jgi:hypothetical protein
VVNRKLKPAAALTLIRRHARANGYVVRELPGRGKGSHRIYALDDSSGLEVARFGLTSHPRELSWKLLTDLERGLAPLFGDKWTENRWPPTP